ncbi:MAG: M20/M25/M40 family metallo-hydrolase [Acidobacteria bacterium]|nr:M20/M25/M40 family metallo-hydrolase [Acidobacteriota bacterium]
MFRRKFISALLLAAFVLPTAALARGGAVYQAPKETIDKIKEEGMKNSQVMETLSYLTNVIGGRLTNSPNMKRANEWTRDQMTKWGMQNAHLESWGPFGRGWELKRFSAQVSAPYSFPLIAYPKAWSPGIAVAPPAPAPDPKGKKSKMDAPTPPPSTVVTSDVVLFDAKTEADYAKYKGQLKGKIVLMSDVREIKADFDGYGTRLGDKELLAMANAPDPASVQRPTGGQPNMAAMQSRLERFMNGIKRTKFLIEEGAALVVDNSGNGSGGTIFVSAASVAADVPANPMDFFTQKRLQPWDKEAESKMVPQMTVATEDYNRLVRMIQAGEKVQMTVDLAVQYHDEDTMAYNTVAEIPGTDPTLKEELVMLGGHMDSWHSGTGATDNAAGVAVAMEAARIIQTLGLKPRRTIRVALWSGEEQGLFGSSNYVKQHFGEMIGGPNIFGIPQPNAPKPELKKGADYDKLSAYYNLDNGTGKIRGVYTQGNSEVWPIFRAWLAPFADLGATTLTMQNTGGTDHLSFDRIGLPGFQFIQDEIEYDTRTHHSNQDVYDRIQPDDMKQAATIMAAFVYQTAMMDEKMPRKAMR